MMKYKIYLDDVRIPLDEEWIIVRNYDEFVSKISEFGLENIKLISLDHDLDRTSMVEWSKNTYYNYEINYNNISEKTGLDCAKWLVFQWKVGKPIVDVIVHSANAIGSANIMGYINHYLHTMRLPQTCIRAQIAHTVDENLVSKY